jgi:Autotransporter beta-domain/Bacterial Ig domain
MQNIFSTFTRAIWQLVIGLFLLASVTFANAQSSCTNGPSYGYSTYFITEAGNSITASVSISCVGVALTNEPVEWLITNPSPGDSALPVTGLSDTSGNAQVNVQLGSTAGTRTLKFCIGKGGCSNLANPSATQPIYVFVTQCAPTVVNSNLSVGGSATVSANCTAFSDNTTTVTSTAYSWQVTPNGAPLPSTTQGTATLTFLQAGTYTYTVLPTYTISVNGSLVNMSSFTAKARSPSVSVTVNATNPPPTVAITSPLNNATFTAPISNIPLLVATTTPPGTTITQVQYLLPSGIAISTNNISPFSGIFGTKIAGTFIITPRITLNNGVSADGAPVTIIVNNPPTVNIATPANGATSIALAPIKLTANATSPGSPITKVEYFAGTTRIGQASAAPFEATWSPALPNAYSVTAVLTNQAGETATSLPITIKVNAPNPADVLCAVAVLPKSIKVGEAVTLQAVCKRNGILIAAATLPSPESISYEWRAGTGSPPITTSTTSDTLVLPKTAFTRSGFFSYQVVAKLTNPQFPTASATSNTAEGIVEVKSSATRIDVITAAGSLRVLPGEIVNFSFRVLDGTNPVPGQEVKIAIIGGNVKRTTSKAGLQKAFSNCVAQDVLAQQSVMTNNNGEGMVNFTAGCATGGRTVVLAAGDVQKSVELNGPDQLAQKLALLNGASLVNAEPNKPAAVSVKVVDSNNAAVVSSTTKWTIDPAAAGIVVATAVSNNEGVATTTLTLNPGYKSAQLEVCIEGSASGTADKCKKIQVRNSIAAIVEPATAMTQAIVQQAVDAPRVQLNNIRNRLQQLRVEEVGGGGSDKSGSSAGQNGSKLGVFVLGEIDLAKRQSASGETTYKLRTKGVTVGADYRAQKNVVVGAAFGALLGDTTLTGGSQKTKGYSASVFGQWLPSDNWYVNSIVNLGKNRIDNRRTSVSGENLTGRGTTTQQAFQVETGYGLSKDGARFTPFVRYEMIRAKLKPFEESGGADALAISGQTVRANTFGLGAIAEYAISTANGVWIPSGRVEFLSESQKQNAAFARLVNGTPVLAPLSVDAIDKSYGTWGLNLQWLTGTGGNLVSSFVGYEQTFGKTGFKNDRFTAGVKIPF